MTTIKDELVNATRFGKEVVYALTRLALQTGGSFTVSDREGDRGPFDLERLRKYMPSYDSAAEYVAALQASPLRQAISDVAVMTYQATEDLIPPRTLFMAARSDRYPYSISRTYIHPIAFRQILARELVKERARTMQRYLLVKRALDHLQGNRRVDIDYQYSKEESPRWRAWYDLSKGRLLALAVRYQEYYALCNLLLAHPEVLSPPTNVTGFAPSTEFRDTTSAELAEESRQLLTRCIESNPETPWSHLAPLELDKPLGVQLEQGIVPPPPPPPPIRPAMGRVRAPGAVPFPRL